MKHRIVYILAVFLVSIAGLGCSGDENAEPCSLHFRFPELPPIANADPSTRLPKVFQVPTRLRIEKKADGMSFRLRVDQDSLEQLELKVGANMVTGFRHEIRILKGEEWVLQGYGGTTNTKANFGTGYQKMPQPGETYVMEMRVDIFETDIPAQHKWNPRGSDKYKVLWTRTLFLSVE